MVYFVGFAWRSTGEVGLELDQQHRCLLGYVVVHCLDLLILTFDVLKAKILSMEREIRNNSPWHTTVIVSELYISDVVVTANTRL